MMQLIKYPAKENWSEILLRPQQDFADIKEKVQSIINDVKATGDEALKKYTKQFDGVELNDFKVQDEEWKAAEAIDEKLKAAIRTAIKNVNTFHQSQKEDVKKIETMPGITCWRKSIPIEKVGLYIPGGTAPLFSTLIMLAVPAKIAGCKEIIVCTPPQKDGTIHPAILFVAKEIGINTIYKLGGVQAISAMAYGTESISKLYKIFGPGNRFITYAKMLIASEGVAIDMPAGPSEVAIIADETCNAEFVAADLLSQCEHGKDSQVVLISNNEKVIEEINEQLKKQLNNLPRKEIAEQSLKNSKAILVETLDEAIELINEYAPEHLIIACDKAIELSQKITNAGSVFIGNYSPEAVGDYASGTNHTLPTNGFAKAYSGVSLDSFYKKITFQQLTKDGLKNIAETVELMAEAEGLQAHANAITIRRNK
ncbi:MAG TPA: histidinol dehydrogenase [Parafilimonas sp.]|nr:histidinol dehydrogenase [Parafilimonas sp.]